MKNLIFCLLLSPLVAFTSFELVNMTDISNAIKRGDTVALSKFFDDDVEVAVLDHEDIYDKATAKKVIGDFFAQYPPKSFNQVHQGTSRGKDSQYLIGNMKAGTLTFRVYLYMKVEGSDLRIQEIRFDEE